MKHVCDGISHCEDGKDEDEPACEKKNRLCTKEPYNGGCGKHFCLGFCHSRDKTRSESDRMC